MNKGLSKREKVLIFIAATLTMAFVSIKFITMPLYNGYADKTGEYAGLCLEKTVLELTLSNENTAREKYAASQQDYAEIGELYPTLMPNEEIDRILTGLCRDNNLNPIALKLSEIADYTSPSLTEEEKDAEADPAKAAFSIVTADMTLKGHYDSLKDLLDTVKDIEYIRVCRASFARDTEGKGVNQSNITVTFEVTMFNY